MSQEFLDHLKEHGIIAHRTPPYTPQNNGVSERRNRTLLDMVRSMMSQTTLPKSFWDYALETAARILNMVPSKKVDKEHHTKYGNGQAPMRLLNSLGFKWECGRSELIQEEDTNPSVDTSLNHEEDDQEIDEPQSDINPIRRSTRTRRPTDRLCLYIDTEEHELGDLGEPANYRAALLDPESKKWLDAMNVEMQSMKDNDVWVLVELPPNARTVGSKWLFKKKTDMDGAVYIFKARLVAKGFTQTYGVDYEETFSPVADIRAIRILIAIAAYYDYEIWQMDVKTAFLNGHLSEEVYMEQPEGFVNPKYPNHVCKLKRSIYGLKQASRQWNKRFDDEIKQFGFTQNPDEPYVYLKASGSYVAILILYVDDILLMGNNTPMLQDVKSYLRRSFAMKDLGEAAYILGIKIYRDRFYMENSKRGTIPMQEKLKLSKSQGASTPAEKQRMQNIPYALAIGSIMYAVRCTRPDVAFAQNMTSRFQQNLGEEHWTAVKNILKYLRNTKDMFLTGYVFVLNGGAVDWKSTKQSIFATSSTDAEYIAAFDASKEAVWIRKFISGLGIVPTIEEPISMYCDNTGAIAIAKDDGVTKGARHFRAKVHYLRETIKMGDVKIEKIDTDDNLADPFTKALAFPKHSELTWEFSPNAVLKQERYHWALSRFNQINEWPFPKAEPELLQTVKNNTLARRGEDSSTHLRRITTKTPFATMWRSWALEKELSRYLTELMKKKKLSQGASASDSARSLNMVPSKKVDKTPYEIWHGQAPKLSYLRVWDNSLPSAKGSIMICCEMVLVLNVALHTNDKPLSTESWISDDAENLKYAEYIAAFDASKEAVWIRKFISGLGIVPKIEEPISMYCDNTGAIAIAKDDGVTKGARHFRAKVH
ncbi:retrotransposon protein, putative, ty1-copia subclass [Tanacetum coccineum]